ncbi:MAG TPA: methionyl-tRNA formyltransferase, partial [Telluria sp.]|nr:methionyl-tRNA formyltransferase [Telluria sp.]
RGAAPIHRAIESGDPETGVTIMQMEEGLDTGPMLLIERVAIGAADTTGTLHDKLAALGGTMIVDALRQMEQGALAAQAQPELGVTYAAKISKEEARLDFALPAVELARKVRAFNPFPGAQGLVNGVTVKIWQAEAVDGGVNPEPGKVLSADAQNGIVVACGTGTLRLTELQKPGGKRQPASEFLKSFPLEEQRFE